MSIVLFLSLLSAGAYYEYQSYLLSTVILILIWEKASKEGVLIWKNNCLVVASFIISLLYIISPVWAVDGHMAFYGGLKFLPVTLCVILYMQNPKEKEKVVKKLPIIGTAITFISFAASLLPELRNYLWTAGRLAGTLQYPNTFGIFLLVCLLCIVNAQDLNRKSVAEASVLITGILLTGSRTVFLIMPVALLTNAFIARNKNRKICCCAIVGVPLAVALVGIFFKGDTILIRFTEISLSQSTLLGRVLYWKDALPIILKNPLGLGYMGYYFTQGSFQTGVYSVTHAHNEFLQMFLDIGWLGGAVFIGMWVYGFIKAETGWHRIVLAVMATHAFVDFDFQYMAMYMVLMAFIPLEKGGDKKMLWGAIKRCTGAVSLCIVIALEYFTLGNAAYYFNVQKAKNWFYPENTLWLIEELTQAEDLESIQNLSEKILETNESVSLAWSGMARIALSDGDIENMMTYKRKAISLAKYSVEEYEDYLEMLLIAAQLYKQAGESGSAEYCLKEALNIPMWVDEVKVQTDSLAWRLMDKPELALSKEYQSYIDIIKKETEEKE